MSAPENASPEKMAPERVTLRPVGEADDGFLFAVYTTTREEEMARVPWTPEQKAAFLRMQFTAQKQHYAAEYPGANHSIICVDGIQVGRIYVDRTAETFHILDITVLPQYRNAGAGACVLRRLLEEAAGAGKPVTIYVESFNRSLSLFHALGFQKIADQGFNWLLRWTHHG